MRVFLPCRNDPKYISSLGRTIYNFSCLVPHGLLVFFPSYPVMKKCRDDWQSVGLWSKIADKKPIYVEPQSKEGFANIMNEFYEKIRDPSCKGAIFMAVCRGKVSEGLDFANANGRAVLITGLPYPPLKDPRVMLKQRYLDENRAKQKEVTFSKETDYEYPSPQVFITNRVILFRVCPDNNGISWKHHEP